MDTVRRKVLVAVWQRRYSVDHAVDELCGRRNGNVKRDVTCIITELRLREINVDEAGRDIACILDQESDASDAT